jgi:hypothetical protein
MHHSNRYYPIETLDFAAEKELLWKSFQDASRDVQVSFGFATAERLRSELTMRCRAIHFSGHGSQHFLSFEDGRGGLHGLSAADVRHLCGSGNNANSNGNTNNNASLSASSSDVQFVFVSACYSEFAGNAFVEAGIPHVVCVSVENGRLLDKAAQVFTRAFYLSLAVGDTIHTAFDIACQAVAVSPSHAASESQKFKLLPEGADHHVHLFPDTKVIPHWPPPRPSLPDTLSHSPSGESLVLPLMRNVSLSRSTSATSRAEFGSDGQSPAGGVFGVFGGGFLPTTAEDFLGRNVDMYKALLYMLGRRLVTLSGPSGVGKTMVAVATAHYASEREYFGDGVAFIRVGEVDRVDRLVDALCGVLRQNPVGSDSTTSPLQSAHGGGSSSNNNNNDISNSSNAASTASDEFKLKYVCQALRNRKCLLLLDNVDALVDAQFERLRHVLGRLLDQTKAVRVMLTTCRPNGVGGLPGFPEAVHHIQPLKPHDAAKLFVRLSPHNHQLGDSEFVPVGMDAGDNLDDPGALRFDLLHVIADAPEVAKLNGFPRQIAEFAYQQPKDDYIRIVQESRVALRARREQMRAGTSPSATTVL